MSETIIQDTLFGEAEPEVRMLTVKQPWAWALIHVGKDVENRSRPMSYRGRLIIHAGLAVDAAGVAFLEAQGIAVPPEALQGGCIQGSVEVTGCVTDSSSAWAQENRHHIQCAGPVPATRRVKVRGNLGLQRPPQGWEQAFAA